MDSQKERYMENARSGNYDICIWGAGFLGTQKGLQLLSKRGISVDYYCDNNSKLWGSDIVEGIPCISPEELQQRKDTVVCFLMVGYMKVAPILQQMENMGIEQIIVFDDLLIEEKEEYFPFMKRNQIAFYTCIVGGYDNLREPLSIIPECDYYLISDKKPEQETVFQYIDINQYLPDGITDNTKKNRYCKINAHKIFPQYRYSLYCDGQWQIDSSVLKYIKQLPKTRITAFCKSDWEGPYMEAMHVILNKRDAEDVVRRQIEKYWLEGMPEQFGSVFCGMLIREHNNPVCRKLMEDWWKQIEQFSKRDMISFPYILWKNGYSINDVDTVTDKWQYEGEYWSISRNHNQSRLVYNGKVIY